MGPHMKHKAVCLPLAGTGARGRGVVSRSPRELAVRAPLAVLQKQMSVTLK